MGKLERGENQHKDCVNVVDQKEGLGTPLPKPRKHHGVVQILRLRLDAIAESILAHRNIAIGWGESGSRKQSIEQEPAHPERGSGEQQIKPPRCDRNLLPIKENKRCEHCEKRLSAKPHAQQLEPLSPLILPPPPLLEPPFQYRERAQTEPGLQPNQRSGGDARKSSRPNKHAPPHRCKRRHHERRHAPRPSPCLRRTLT
mmetsp:Transcript_25226/g.82822  ORF Transcript_25226/g.82822 Transcript_25226/m.82822 type:complete len:200 (-) Transcript_25226:195-794(-)